MVSIRGTVQSISKPEAKKRKKSVNKPNEEAVNQSSLVPTPLAKAIRNPNMAQSAFEQVQYDLPNGKNQEAIHEYLKIKNQSKREALFAIFGVDIFV